MGSGHGAGRRGVSLGRAGRSLGGTLSGIMLCAASATQQIGIAYTTASKAGFITALYVVLVPIFSIFIRKRPSFRVWFCVLLALVGLYLLCITSDSFTLEYGDAWELVCAFLFAVEILILSYYSSRLDAVRLSRMQFLVMAILSTVLMLLTEKTSGENFLRALPSILYAGIFSSGIAYTLQILGQDGVNATVASLVMSLESVFSALSGWIVLHERMSPRELLGAALMMLAIVLSQVEFPTRRKKRPFPPTAQSGE